MTIQLTQIKAEDRIRDNKKHGDLVGLADSISSVGLIQPLVLSRSNDENYTLVAGGRRLDALRKLGHTELHHNIVLDPKRPGFVFADEVPEHIRVEAELDENLHRLEMDWVDEVLAVDKIHKLKKDVNAKWGVRQTAAILKGTDKTKVSYAIRIAKCLRSHDKDILACKNMSDAIALLVKRKEDEALAELQRRVIVAQPAIPTNPSDLSSFLDVFSIQASEPKKGGDATSQSLTTKEVGATSSGATKVQPSVAPPITIPLSRMFIHGDSMTILPTLSDHSYDHILTDPPYGINMENLDEKQIASVKDTHDVDQNIRMFQPFLYNAFRIVKPGGFCVFFYDLDHHEKLRDIAKDAGWKVQRWPFLALKTSTCRNNSPQYNTTKNYESAMLLRKDGHTVLRKPITSSWNTYDFAMERELYNNPFSKPFPLWKDLLEMISFPGQSILDPFAGEMSSCRAVANCGRVPHGIEIGVEHYNRGLGHMRAVFSLIHSSNVNFV